MGGPGLIRRMVVTAVDGMETSETSSYNLAHFRGVDHLLHLIHQYFTAGLLSMGSLMSWRFIYRHSVPGQIIVTQTFLLHTPLDSDLYVLYFIQLHPIPCAVHSMHHTSPLYKLCCTRTQHIHHSTDCAVYSAVHITELYTLCCTFHTIHCSPLYTGLYIV